MVPTMWTGVPEDLAVEEFALPAQFTCGWRQPLTPVRRLAFSVLWAAIFDLYKYRFVTRRRHQRLYWEAWEWVASANRSWGFSFERLCEEFRIEPAEARAKLLDVRLPSFVILPCGDADGSDTASRGDVQQAA